MIEKFYLHKPYNFDEKPFEDFLQPYAKPSKGYVYQEAYYHWQPKYAYWFKNENGDLEYISDSEVSKRLIQPDKKDQFYLKYEEKYDLVDIKMDSEKGYNSSYDLIGYNLEDCYYITAEDIAELLRLGYLISVHDYTYDENKNLARTVSFTENQYEE